jgi:hypothetical protein
MNGDHGRDEAAAPNGSLLRLSEMRGIAIYRRDGVARVADFRGARAELASIAPLPADVIERIARQHGAEDRAPLAALGARLARFCHELSCRVPAGVPSPRTQRS